jgi:hypothetical protein
MTIEAEMMRIYLKSQTAKRTAAAVAAEYHWSESKNCYVPIAWMHPQWARNALDKFMNDREPADEIDKIYIWNLINRIYTPANRISQYAI